MKSFIVFAVCIGVVLGYGDSPQYVRRSNGPRAGVRYENFDEDIQQLRPSDEVCRMCAIRCGQVSSTDTIPTSSSNTYQVPIKVEGRPSSESQLGHTTSTSSSSSSSSSSNVASSSSASGYGGNFGLKDPRDNVLFTIYHHLPFGTPESGLKPYIDQTQHSAQEQLQNTSGEGHKTTSAIDHGEIKPLISAIPPPSSGGQFHAWEKSTSWSSQSTYDSNGHRTSNSHFSTGEGEDHTIDGKTTSFRAASTTLDDNGRRSTYNIRTP